MDHPVGSFLVKTAPGTTGNAAVLPLPGVLSSRLYRYGYRSNRVPGTTGDLQRYYRWESIVLGSGTIASLSVLPLPPGGVPPRATGSTSEGGTTAEGIFLRG